MADILVIAVNTIHDNISGVFELLDEVDPNTGHFKMRAVPRITQPGEWALFPEDEAARLIASDAARCPTEAELQLRRMHTGA
jgi:hypothetical protein